MSLFSPEKIIALVGLGAAAGLFSGLVGIGGGVIIVPALVYFLGLDQHRAQGTTLAMLLPPVGLLAAWAYYKEGFVDLPLAGFLCLGFLVGGWGGAKIAIGMPTPWLGKIFGVLIVVMGLRMIFKP